MSAAKAFGPSINPAIRRFVKHEGQHHGWTIRAFTDGSVVVGRPDQHYTLDQVDEKTASDLPADALDALLTQLKMYLEALETLSEAR